MLSFSKFVALCTVFFAPLLSVAQAQTPKTKITNFYGVLDVKVERLRMHLIIVEDENGLSGKSISVDQGNAEDELDSISLADGKLKFKIKKVDVSYEGTFNEDKTIATGKFKQGGTSFDLALRRVNNFPETVHSETWTGIMKAGVQEFDFQLRVFRAPNGQRFARLDSFSEKIGNLYAPIDSEFEGLKFSVPSTAAVYEATLSDDKKTATGSWKQNGANLPLELKRVELTETRILKRNRPQTPKAPFDYDIAEHEIGSKKHTGVKLSATLTTPKGDGPFPATILISGSGPQDRDSTIYGHKSFAVIADHFAKNGIATLRYDERGVGKSEGDFEMATSRDLADDAETLAQWLTQQPKIDAKKMILVGHSEGGLIAPMVASENKDVAAVIMLAGPAVDGEKVVMSQTRKILAGMGASPAMLDGQGKMMGKFIKTIKLGKEIPDAAIKNAFTVFSGTVPDHMKGLVGSADDMKQQVAQLNTPWFRYFLNYNPAESLKKTKCPILFLIGDKDTQVDAELHVPVAKKIFDETGNKQTAIVRYPSLNHLFQECKTGLPNEYVTIEQTISPKVLETMSNWIEKSLE